MSQDKRLFLALGLCIFVMVALQMLFPGKPLPRKPVPAKVPAVAPAPPVVAAGPSPAPPVPGPVPAPAAGAANGGGLQPPVPAETPPVRLDSGRIHAMVTCRGGGSLGKTWLEGIPALPGSDASREAGALEFLNEIHPGQPGAFATTLFSRFVDLEDLELRPWEVVSKPGEMPLVLRTRALKHEREEGKGIVVEKRILPAAGRDAWHFRMEIEIRNGDPELAGFKSELRVRGAAMVHDPEGARDLIYGRVKLRKTSSPRSTNGGSAQKGIKDHEPVTVEGDVEWTATASTYFAAILDADDPAEGETARPLSVRWDALTAPATPATPHPAPQPSPILSIPVDVPKPGDTVKIGFTVFVGPTANEIRIGDAYVPVLDREEYARFKAVRDPGWFDIISQGLFYILKGFHAIVPSWGLSIVLLTVLVRGCLYPLSRKQLKSTIEYSKKMQKIKPKLDALKEKHGEDRRRMSEEQFRLMKEHDVPLMPGGCLLTFLQLPIWIALYGMLQSSFDLRHAPFLWMGDLSQADHLWHMLPDVRDIPMVPNALEWLNLLPLLMTATWFFSSKATMTPPADEQQAQMQAMMQYMPFIMLLFPGFYTMPAGLCLYITASSTWGIVESRVIRKRLGAT